MSNEVVEVVQECSKMCGIIQSSYFLKLDWLTSHSVEDWRNFCLAVGAPLALALAWWRSVVADRQEKTNRVQSETSQEQLDLAQEGQKLGRYQKGAAMLSSKNLSEREAGIYVLSQLAQDDPRTYFDIAQKVLCSFVKERSAAAKKDQRRMPMGKKFTPQDIFSAVIETCQMNEKRIEQGVTIFNAIDFSEAYLPLSTFSFVHFTGINFSKVDLRNAIFLDCEFTEINFKNADCTSTKFLNSDAQNTTMKEVLFIFAESLTNATFRNVNFDESGFYASDMRQSNFIGCSFDDVTLRDVDLANATFANIEVKGKGVICDASLQQCNIMISPQLEEIRDKQLAEAKDSGSVAD